MRFVRTPTMTSTLKVLTIYCFILFATSQFNIRRWRHYQQVATLSPKGEIVFSHSRVTCASFCDNSNSDSFLYGDDKKCQMLHGEIDDMELQTGEYYEYWVRSDPKTQGSNTGALLVHNEDHLYWYDILTRERIAQVALDDWISHCIYDTKRRIFYWGEDDGPMKCAQLSLGRAGRERRILRKPVGNFCMDFDQEMIFYSNADAGANGDFVRYSRKTKARKLLVKNNDGHFKMWWCTVDPLKQYIFYGELSRGITRIDYNGGDQNFIQQTTVNTIFFSQHDQKLFWIVVSRTDEDEGDITKITYRNAYGTSATKRMDVYMRGCYSIYVLGNVIYYKTETARGVCVVTLDGTRLPDIGTMEIGSGDEPYMFLFK